MMPPPPYVLSNPYLEIMSGRRLTRVMLGREFFMSPRVEARLGRVCVCASYIKGCRCCGSRLPIATFAIRSSRDSSPK